MPIVYLSCCRLFTVPFQPQYIERHRGTELSHTTERDHHSRWKIFCFWLIRFFSFCMLNKIREFFSLIKHRSNSDLMLFNSLLASSCFSEDSLLVVIDDNLMFIQSCHLSASVCLNTHIPLGCSLTLPSRYDRLQLTGWMVCKLPVSQHAAEW